LQNKGGAEVLWAHGLANHNKSAMKSWRKIVGRERRVWASLKKH